MTLYWSSHTRLVANSRSVWHTDFIDTLMLLSRTYTAYISRLPFKIYEHSCDRFSAPAHIQPPGHPTELAPERVHSWQHSSVAVRAQAVPCLVALANPWKRDITSSNGKIFWTVSRFTIDGVLIHKKNVNNVRTWKYESIIRCLSKTPNYSPSEV